MRLKNEWQLALRFALGALIFSIGLGYGSSLYTPIGGPHIEFFDASHPSLSLRNIVAFHIFGFLYPGIYAFIFTLLVGRLAFGTFTARRTFSKWLQLLSYMLAYILGVVAGIPISIANYGKPML